jgi:hypothetical protein
MKKCLLVGIALCIGASQGIQAQNLAQRTKKYAQTAQKKAAALIRYPKRAVQVLKKKYIDKLSLTASEQKLLNSLQIGTIAAIIAALTGGATYVASSQAQPEFQQEVGAGVDTYTILQRWKLPTDIMETLSNLPVSRFLVGVKNAAAESITDLYDLVPKNVLGAGHDIAMAYYNSHIKKVGDATARNLAGKYKVIADREKKRWRDFNLLTVA